MIVINSDSDKIGLIRHYSHSNFGAIQAINLETHQVIPLPTEVLIISSIYMAVVPTHQGLLLTGFSLDNSQLKMLTFNLSNIERESYNQ